MAPYGTIYVHVQEALKLARQSCGLGGVKRVFSQTVTGTVLLCRTLEAPQGYTLRTFPWYVDQTVAGAVATGSHGSDLREGSLSDQARTQQPSACSQKLAHLGGCWLLYYRCCGGWLHVDLPTPIKN